jgi:hypothetical protein
VEGGTSLATHVHQLQWGLSISSTETVLDTQREPLPVKRAAG